MIVKSTQFYQQYRDTILFNKNLVISGLCSLILTAFITQYYYYNVSSNNFEVSLVSLLIEYVIETPIFFVLYYIDNKKIYLNPVTGKKNLSAVKTDLKKLFAVFSLSDVIYAVALISVEFSLLQHSTVEPYQASLCSLIAWAIFCGCQPRGQICSIVRQTAIKKINGDHIGTPICDSHIGRLYYSCQCIYFLSSTSTRVIY